MENIIDAETTESVNLLKMVALDAYSVSSQTFLRKTGYTDSSPGKETLST